MTAHFNDSDRSASSTWKERAGAFALLSAALGYAACSPAYGTDGTRDDEPASSEQEAVTNGMPAFTSDLPALGVVEIVASGVTHGSESGVGLGCSGTLISNRWVLTARHCFCQAHVDVPSSVSVSVYGAAADQANSQLQALYTTTAAQIIRNPTYDVALVQLNQTLPFTQPPLFYTGTGSDVPGKTVSAWGFGDDLLTDAGVSTGGLDSLNWAVMKIDHVGSTNAQETFPNNCDPAETDVGTTGPFTLPMTGSKASTQSGDSGGPLFIEPSTGTDLTNRLLVGSLQGGVLSGSKTYNNYTGIWEVRNWIKTSAPDIAPRSACPAAIPQSSGYTSPSVAPGPDNAIHIVALQASTSTLGHWQFKNGALSLVGTVPGASTTTAAAIGLETVVSGQTQMMGLAYRDKTSGALKYMRWSGTSWTAPVSVLTVTIAGAPAMSSTGGLIAYVGTNNVVSATAYNPANGQFIAPQAVPSESPAADSTKRISIVSDAASGTSYVGYRTTADEWVQAFGSWSSCAPTTGTFWCQPDPKYGTDWKSAALAYGPAQRVSLVTTRLETSTDTVPTLENRVVSGPPSWLWGQNRMKVTGQPGVSQVGFDVWMASEATSGLVFAKTDNCFGNDF